jgi:hypothetical protein
MATLSASCAAQANPRPQPKIAFECGPAPGVDHVRSGKICDKTFAFLKSRHPADLVRLHPSEAENPALTVILSVEKADDRSVGLDVSWRKADGTTIKGTAMNAGFYDKSPADGISRTFLEAFFQENAFPS